MSSLAPYWKSMALAAAAAVAAALALSASPPAAQAKDGRNAALIAGAAIGAAALVAASRSHQSEYYQPYYGQPPYGVAPPPQPVYVPPPYHYQPMAVFHPYPGVTCYPAQRACYKANGNYSPTISSRIYGY